MSACRVIGVEKVGGGSGSGGSWGSSRGSKSVVLALLWVLQAQESLPRALITRRAQSLLIWRKRGSEREEERKGVWKEGKRGGRRCLGSWPGAVGGADSSHK